MKQIVLINEYDIRDYVSATMSKEDRDKMPTVTNNNGRDYASCPKCGHYHAMMPSNVHIENEGMFYFNYCRDCGFLGRVNNDEK